MSMTPHWGSNAPTESEIGDLWLDTSMPHRSRLKVKCATEWVVIAELHAGSEPHDALFNRIRMHCDA